MDAGGPRTAPARDHEPRKHVELARAGDRLAKENLLLVRWERES
jgi:hypothetical protein